MTQNDLYTLLGKLGPMGTWNVNLSYGVDRYVKWTATLDSHSGMGDTPEQALERLAGVILEAAK